MTKESRSVSSRVPMGSPAHMAAFRGHRRQNTSRKSSGNLQNNSIADHAPRRMRNPVETKDRFHSFRVPCMWGTFHFSIQIAMFSLQLDLFLRTDGKSFSFLR